jgi:undecaprenyl-diphosphatase
MMAAFSGASARMRYMTGRVRKEAALLLGGLMVATSLLGFLLLAGEVANGDTYAFDQAVLLELRDPADLGNPIGPVWLEQTAKDLTALGGYPVIVLITALTTVFLVMTARKGAALLLLVSVIGGMIVSSVLKLLFARARPDLVPHITEVFTSSFPSGHATMTTVSYLTLGALLMRVQERFAVKVFVMSAAALIAVIVGISRVYLGVHWPTDVIAGWGVGFAWALACWLVADVLQRRGKIKGGA